jgi:hypothetical protein
MADKIEIRNLSPIIVTKIVVNKYVDESPAVIMFSIIHSTRETVTQRSIKVKEDLYVNDFCEIGACECKERFHLSLNTIKETLEELNYHNYLLDENVKSIFLPHYSFIKYAVETHP